MDRDRSYTSLNLKVPLKVAGCLIFMYILFQACDGLPNCGQDFLPNQVRHFASFASSVSNATKGIALADPRTIMAGE